MVSKLKDRIISNFTSASNAIIVFVYIAIQYPILDKHAIKTSHLINFMSKILKKTCSIRVSKSVHGATNSLKGIKDATL
jgi:hypothetical protein